MPAQALITRPATADASFFLSFCLRVASHHDAQDRARFKAVCGKHSQTRHIADSSLAGTNVPKPQCRPRAEERVSTCEAPRLLLSSTSLLVASPFS
ncbi:hypothetical protein FA95DRAFT_1340590 [Auriscalpium vulgare]|uniref:Uncharacterized protein n=1 Tax=Auriscalpium vulgare TaxID=40419 RepID=A0ACB8RSF4_9AGAM|nr:hypothetical protein FA95DRAFT_1340590 [Auriscalpium vulgare]